MIVYKDLNQPIGLRMEAAKAAMPYEKPRLASIENKIVDEFDNMSIEELEVYNWDHRPGPQGGDWSNAGYAPDYSTEGNATIG